MNTKLAYIVLNLPGYAYEAISTHREVIRTTHPRVTYGDVALAFMQWVADGKADGSSKGMTPYPGQYSSVRVDGARAQEVVQRRVDATRAEATPVSLVVWAALVLNKALRPELFIPYLIRSPIIGEAPVTVTLSKRQTTHLRHLAKAWDMTVPAVVQVLIASNPCMHLPATVTPPQVATALRGVQSLPVGTGQETIVIAG